MSKVEIKTVTQLDRGLAYGECCFETMRVVEGAIFEWARHWQRLQAGLEAFGMALANADKKSLYTAILQAAAGQGDDVLVRLTVSGGEATWGLHPPRERQPQAFLQVMQASPVIAPARLRSVSWPFPLRDKIAKFTSDYADTLRAMQQWQATLPEGCEPLLATSGSEPRLLSGLTANLLLYREGAWHTPSGSGILPGIVRSWLIEHAGVHAMACPLDGLQGVDAMALCNSGHFIRPVAEIDGHPLDAAHPALHQLIELLAGRPGVPHTTKESA
jgi:branched-subunit amino acid aminotransferase/4-amino-4-deoxychorismate lyase